VGAALGTSEVDFHEILTVNGDGVDEGVFEIALHSSSPHTHSLSPHSSQHEHSKQVSQPSSQFPY